VYLLNIRCVRVECVIPPALVLSCSTGVDELPLPSGPQMTRRIGKSFAQLLTSRAVLMAVGLAGDGGGKGRMLCTGAVDARRRGGGKGSDPCGVDAGLWWCWSVPRLMVDAEVPRAAALAESETSWEEP
jgi:hypothetical protein